MLSGYRLRPNWEWCMSARNRLSHLLKFITQEGRASDSDCIRFVVLARELIEEQGTTGRNPTLKLYGDWCVHNRLDRAHAKRVLAEIELLIRDPA